MRFAHVGFPIQRSPDHWIFAPPRSLSQLVTSFFGPQCQGIRPVPLLLDHLLHRPSVGDAVSRFSFDNIVIDVFLSCVIPSKCTGCTKGCRKLASVKAFGRLYMQRSCDWVNRRFTKCIYAPHPHGILTFYIKDACVSYTQTYMYAVFKVHL